MATDQWQPAVGRTAYDRRTGKAVKVTAVHRYRRSGPADLLARGLRAGRGRRGER